ncbi:MAG: ECF-type sigma factor [Phycisphaerae bacterium]
MADSADISKLLKAVETGHGEAVEDLLPILYQELRALAESRLRKMPPGQTLQPTALVHEAYLRLLGKDDSKYENRRHFFFAAARAIHDILVEQARRKAAVKRGGDRQRILLTNLAEAFAAEPDELIVVSSCLEELEKEFPRKHQLVMLRFFAGLTESECATLLGVDRRTVTRDWRFARTWLYKKMETTGGDG